MFSSEKLFQQFIVDAYVKAESNRLNFLRHNQRNLRVETLRGLTDFVNGQEEAENPAGVLLPTSFYGGPRCMAQLYYDSMAMVRRYGKPDLFITFTCNPSWREIKENLFHKQRSQYRPDLVCRVFHIKLKALMTELTNQRLFGAVIAFTFVVEFQKRGLPHAHILLILEESSRLLTSEQIDRHIKAEIPNHLEDPTLYNLVSSHMMHGPCSRFNARSPCMVDNSCSKNFPKEFCDTTVSNFGGLPR